MWGKGLLAVAFAAGLASCATRPPTAPGPSPTFSEVLRPGEGDVVRASGLVSPGQVVLAFPYELRRTGVLKEDVYGWTFEKGSGGVEDRNILFAAAGSPGFMAGRFSRPGATDGWAELWCFERPLATHYTCFFAFGSVAMAQSYDHPPLLVTGFRDLTGQRASHIPSIEEGQASLAFEQRLEFRFSRWSSNELVLEAFTGDQAVGEFRVAREADDIATLRSVAGAVRLTQRGDSAIAEAVETPASAKDIGAHTATFLASPMPFDLSIRPIATVAPGADFKVVARDQLVLTQRMESGPGVRIDEKRHSIVPAGELVFPVLRGTSWLLCRPRWSGEEPPERPKSAKPFCLEDQDRDGFYEVFWAPVSYREELPIISSPGNSFPMFIQAAVTAAPDAPRPRSDLSLLYFGPTRERRDETGKVVAAAVGFTWGIEPTISSAKVKLGVGYEVGLAEDGTGVLQVQDTVIARIRNVDLAKGTAEIKVESGLPVGRELLLSGRSTVQQASAGPASSPTEQTD